MVVAAAWGAPIPDELLETVTASPYVLAVLAVGLILALTFLASLHSRVERLEKRR